MPLYYLKGIDAREVTYPGDPLNIFAQWIPEYDYSTPSTYSGKQFVVKRLSYGAARVSGSTVNQVYATFKFKPREVAAYKVRVTRVNSFSDKTYQIQDRLTMVSLTTRFDRHPIQSPKRHTFLELKIRATNQLNGTVSNLSAIGKSALDVYDPDTQTWSKKVTSNPAWVFVDLLTGEVNPKAIPKTRLHLPSIVEWAQFCDEIPPPAGDLHFDYARYSCDMVLDYDTTLQSLLNAVMGASQASLNIIDGKYGVLLDKKKDIPVQVFTPRNSKDFSSSRTYRDPPHALKVRYVDPSNNWEIGECIVYNNGYDEETATEFDEISSFACTGYEQAWRFGRYMMAQAALRQETISITVDFEHIVCTRGDFVQITQDVMKAGGKPARVVSLTGNRVVIDDPIETSNLLDYGYVIRRVDGIKNSTLTVISSDEFELDGDLPNVGDIIVIGETGKIVLDCLVKSISPYNDLSATLILVEKADAVYDAESSVEIPTYDPQLNTNVPTQSLIPPPVEDLVVVSNSWRVVGDSYQYYIGIDWDLPTGAAYEIFEVYVDSGRGYDLVDSTKESFYEYIVNPANLGVLHSFKVLAVSAEGKKIDLIEAPSVSATPLRKTEAPSDVEALYINITDQVIAFEWPLVIDPDIREYLIRYSPTDSGSWAASTPLLKAGKNTNQASTQGRKGTYLIKAVDFNGNESLNAAIALTSIPSLFDLNIIEETNDLPALLGTKVQVVKDGNTLILETVVAGGVDTNEYYSEGYYYYKNLLDLGEIYTVRLQSQVQAEGYTEGDRMSNWNPLSSVLKMSNALQSEWDVEAQYRATNNLNVMSDWMTLSSIDPISEGEQEAWTPWRKFTIGDFTGRIFQFRLKLISRLASVTPRVYSGVIKSDMPDRLESFNNLMSSDLGTEVTYSVPFKGPGNSPNIQVTQDNAEAGDRYEITDKTLEGFTITFYDISNTPVSRQFDVSVKGYGRRAQSTI